MTTEINSNEVEAIKKLKELVNQTYEAKLRASEAEEAYKKLQTQLNELMQSSEIDSFEGDRCKVFCKPKSSVSFPKDASQKAKLFDYIKNKYSEEVLQDMLTINPRSFVSWYNAEAEAALLEGNLDFNIADIKPYEYFSLSFRKK